MRTVVTGAAGFIGSTLVDRLLSEGHSVVAIDNLSTGFPSNLSDALQRQSRDGRVFTFIEADVRDREVADIIEEARPDVVLHLAAQVDVRVSVEQPRDDAADNIMGTINVLQACCQAGVPRIVYAASGGSRYGSPQRLPVSETASVAPMSPYAASKLAGEMYLTAFAAMYGISPIALGLSNVYGPRQNPHGEAGVVAIFGNAMLTGRPTVIFGDGSTTRDYVYVGDVAEAFLRAAESPLEVAGLYNIGTGDQTTVLDLYWMVASAAGGAPSPVFAPARTGEVPRISLDRSKAATELGWTPSVRIEQGVKQTVAWLRRVGAQQALTVPVGGHA